MYIDENLFKVLLIKALGVNFPLFHHIKRAPNKVIMLVTNSSCFSAVQDILLQGSKEVVSISTMTDKKVWLSKLKQSYSDVAVIMARNPHKSDDMLHDIADIFKSGYIEEKKIFSLPVILVDETYCSISVDNFFMVYLENLEEIDFTGRNQVQLVPKEEQVGQIIKYSNASSSMRSSLELALEAMILADNRLAEHKAFYLDIINRMIEQDDNKYGIENITAIISDCFYELGGVQTAQASKDKAPVKEGVILFDNEFFYIGENYFKRIIQKKLQHISIDMIKQNLTKEGTLVPYPSSTESYTVKIPIYCEGKIIRMHMLRFRQDRLDREGDMRLLDVWNVIEEERT